MAKQPAMEKLISELTRTKTRRDEMNRKIKELEEKILELKREQIVGLVEEAELTPEQLAVVIDNARKGILGVIPGKENRKNEN